MAESSVGTLTIDQLSARRYRVTLVIDVERLVSGAAVQDEVGPGGERRSDRQVQDVEGRGEPRLLLTVGEAAEELAVGRGTVYELLRAGRLESVTIGRLRRIPYKALVAYVDGLLG